MLYKEIIAVCSETDREHINLFCEQSLELFNLVSAGTWSNHGLFSDDLRN
jgi:hypothetical protein